MIIAPQTLLSLVNGPFISFLKPARPGEYTAFAAKYVAKSITWTISALTGTHLPLGDEKQFKLSVLLKDSRVMTGIPTHTLMTQPSELGADALNHSAAQAKKCQLKRQAVDQLKHLAAWYSCPAIQSKTSTSVSKLFVIRHARGYFYKYFTLTPMFESWCCLWILKLSKDNFQFAFDMSDMCPS